MPSFSTAYSCAACGLSSNVEVTDLGDPYKHIPERSQDVLRRIRTTENELGQTKPGDPVDELAQKLLEQEARSELRYATCPECLAKNPEGIAANQTDRRQTLLFGGIFFGAFAAIAWFFPWAALILPAMDLVFFRPLMFIQARKNTDKPFPVVPFAAGIVFDFLLIAVILIHPPAAPLIPIAGIVQSFFGGSGKYNWKWDEAEKKLRFKSRPNANP